MKFIKSFLFLICIVSNATAQNSEQIKIGVVVPLSGPISNYGTSITNMITLAAENLQDDKKVKFIFEDDSFQPQKTVAAVKKLITSDQVKGLIIFGSGTTLAAIPLIEKQQIPTIAIAIADSIVQDHPYVFRLHLPVIRQNDAILKEVKNKNYKTVGIVTLEQEAMLQHRSMFLKDNSLPIVVDEQVLPGTTELQTLATRIIARKPDAVYLMLLSPALSILPQQMRQMGYKGDFFGPVTIQNKSAVKAAQGGLEGTWFVSVDDSKADNLYRQYKDRFKDSDPEIEGCNGYDAASLFINASKQANIIDYLRNPKDFTGVLGKYTLVAPNTFDFSVRLKTVKNGAFILKD